MTNEAAWVYLRGLYHTGEGVTKDNRVALKDLKTLRPYCESLPDNRFAVMCMADIHEKDLQLKI